MPRDCPWLRGHSPDLLTGGHSLGPGWPSCPPWQMAPAVCPPPPAGHSTLPPTRPGYSVGPAPNSSRDLTHRTPWVPTTCDSCPHVCVHPPGGASAVGTPCWVWKDKGEAPTPWQDRRGGRTARWEDTGRAKGWLLQRAWELRGPETCLQRGLPCDTGPPRARLRLLDGPGREVTPPG